MLDQRTTELEEKVTKLLAWAKKTERLVFDLEKEVEELQIPKKKNNSVANLWSDEEKSFLVSKLTGVKTPRPVLISLVEKWEDKFNRQRSYDSLRKMWARLKAQ